MDEWKDKAKLVLFFCGCIVVVTVVVSWMVWR